MLIIIQYIITVAGFQILESLLSCGIAAFVIAFEATKEITDTLKSIDNNAKSTENERQAFEQLHDYIQFHSILKQLGYNDPIPCTSIAFYDIIFFRFVLGFFTSSYGFINRFL